MISRRATGLLVASLLAGLAIQGCGTFDNNDDAAVIDGVALPRDDYEAVLEAFAAEPELSQLVEDPATGTVPGDDGRSWLTFMVLGTADQQFLAASGESITDADRQAVLDGVPEDDPVLELPDHIVQRIVDRQAAAAAPTRIAAPDAAELERRYTESPASLGVVCARHILVATEAEADDVLADLEAGADFEELAAERSTDPAAADNGGVLTDGSGDCLPLSALAGAGSDFVAALRDGAIGEPRGPVQTSAGWHVVVLRPYDEIGDAVEALYVDQAGELLLSAYLATSDITIDPRYGRWDRATNSVIAL